MYVHFYSEIFYYEPSIARAVNISRIQMDISRKCVCVCFLFFDVTRFCFMFTSPVYISAEIEGSSKTIFGPINNHQGNVHNDVT